MVLEKLSKLIAEHKDVDPAGITLETTLESLGLDSLEVVEIIMEFEEETGVAIEVNEKLKTVGDVVKLIGECE
ncbi:acyl carrier protein [Papillibacter cinnamivorans]|uniref:Acyl carrier protein n=1 Tax=Papillibacter cinnamivorans DSM 12816 TaxID=1122930 RepID=A0A1W2AH54_9FIRM|nr:acyl carrier protein [Papillibacter cinnamivorans]SMC60049.1 acyl carrier protein [Papillibacter cinnamivorans DSM 12816]